MNVKKNPWRILVGNLTSTFYYAIAIIIIGTYLE